VFVGYLCLGFDMSHWYPRAEGSPVFLRYNSNDTTVKALTQSQVELHKLRTAHHKLVALSQHNDEEWTQLRSNMVLTRDLCSLL